MRLCAGQRRGRGDKAHSPVRVRLKGGEYRFITPSTRFAEMKELAGATKETLEVDTFNFYIGVLLE